MRTYILGYGIVACLSFMGLTTFWARVHRPVGEDGEWDELDITVFGIIQSLLWPAFLLIYTGGGILFGAFRIAKGWVSVVAPKQRAVLSAAATPKKDPYLARGESEVEVFLTEDRYAQLEHGP